MWHSETLGVIQTPKEITIEGVTHPRQIFHQWDKAQLAELGITPARFETPDQRYYNIGAESSSVVDGETVITYAGTEKNVDQLKVQVISDIDTHIGMLLKLSDWRVIREMDGGTSMTDEWKTYRNEVRTHGNSLQNGVEAFASLQAIINFQNHAVIEVRYTSTFDSDGKETIGPGTEEFNLVVNKGTWGWPIAADAVADPYHVEYK